jgi:EpsI family protein
VATDLALPDRAPVRAGAPAPFAWQPAFPEAAAHRTWWLSGPDGPVGLFVASYPRPAPGQEFTARNSRLVAQDAAVVARDRAAWRPGEGWPEPLEIRVTPADGPERVIWAWYRVDGHVTVDPIRVKALRLWAELTGRVDRAGVIALAAEGPDPAKRLRGLVDNAHPAALWHAAIGRKTMAANQDEEG